MVEQDISLFFRFGIALLVGVLVGLQREYAFGDENDKGRRLFAGVRTFALMGLLGCGAALVSDTLASPWPLVATLIIIGAFLAVGYSIDASKYGKVGLTSEVTAVLIILIGALAYWGQIALAVALGVTTTTLLSLKFETKRLVQQITDQDVIATLKFTIITAIILPILPNENFGPPPLNVFNPYKVWLLVVLISGISFVGYILIKILGARKGVGLLGLLGGLASSTAVTLSLTQRSRSEADMGKPFALAITIAWTVMFSRIVMLVAAINISLVSLVWLPMLYAIVVGLGYCLYLFLAQRSDKQEEVAFINPFELGPAMKFGLLFSVILFISKIAEVYLGDTGIYISSLVSGLADVDAIALSMAELGYPKGQIAANIAARAIVLAAAANTFSKGGIVIIGGSPALRRAIAPGFVLMLVTAIGGAWMI